MTRAEYIKELFDLVNAFDDHVTSDEVVFALRALAKVVELTGFDD